MTLPFLPFPKVGDHAGAWARAVLKSGWNLDGKHSKHKPARVRELLESIARDEPRRGTDDLDPHELEALEDVMSDYRSAYIEDQKREARRPKSYWD